MIYSSSRASTADGDYRGRSVASTVVRRRSYSHCEGTSIYRYRLDDALLEVFIGKMMAVRGSAAEQKCVQHNY